MVRNTVKHGFTLIELLVAVSIIAVLSTVGITIFQGSQAKARDAVRKNDLTKLATALEVYHQQNQKYIGTPKPDGSCDTTTDQFYSSIASKINGPVPLDPSTGTQYLYTAENKCQSYRLFAKLEKCADSAGNLCGYTNYNHTVVSDDLTVASAAGDTLASAPTNTPAPATTPVSTPAPPPAATSTPTPPPPTPPPPTPTPCTLTSASWDSPATVAAFTGVTLKLQTSGDCSGKSVSFRIFEDDVLVDDPARTNPANAAITGSTATSTWVAEYQPDCPILGFPTCDPPEYYFKANIVGQTTDITSADPKLSVTAAPPACVITTASISLNDGNSNGFADSGELVRMRATDPPPTCVVGDGDYFVIEAKSTDNTCNIQWRDGQIFGITHNLGQPWPTLVGDQYQANWVVWVEPDGTIPAACVGKTVYAWRAALWDNGSPDSGTLLTNVLTDASPADSSPVSGSITFLPGNCSGNIALSMSPNPITATEIPGGGASVTFTASGLTNCYNKTIFFDPSFPDCSTGATSPTGCSQTGNGPPYDGSYPYTAKIDINGDGDYTDAGESASATLVVNPKSTPTPTKTPTPIPTLAKRVFVTSTSYNGNLEGLVGADAKCQAAADKLGGTWMAWLSDSTSSPSSRFSETVRSTTSPVTFKLVDNTTIIANGWSDLIDGNLNHVIDRTEQNLVINTVSSIRWDVWTGTSQDGTVSNPTKTCNNWTSNAPGGFGTFGLTDKVNLLWTNAGGDFCVQSIRLYCFEQ